MAALRAACVAALAAAVLPGLRMLSFIWDTSEYLGYGYLVPASSVALCFATRAQIRAALRQAEVPAWGAAWVLAAAAIESLGVLGDVATLAGVGVPLMFAATAYALGGEPLLRALRLPIAFLVFMVPPPDFLLDGALLALKSLVIQAAVALLQLGGAAVAAQGNRLFVPKHELFVANACSGLRSIVTLLPLAVVVATFAARGAWRRALILISVVPFAVLGNIARVITTVLLVSHWGDAYAQGTLHDGFGFATFGLGAVALVALARTVR
ncbi:MAG: exosortase/archaeosortase family protein [Myxococcota bacterium]